MMSLLPRSQSSSLGDDEEPGHYPLPVPYVVRNGFAITFLSFLLLVLPCGYLSALANAFIHKLLMSSLGIATPILPLGFHFVTGATTAALPGLLLMFGATSRFVVASVLELERRGEVAAARKLALAHHRQVWFRHWRRSPAFRRFVLSEGLCEPGTQYLKYRKRYSPRCENDGGTHGVPDEPENPAGDDPRPRIR